jgi:hypothetical protein
MIIKVRQTIASVRDVCLPYILDMFEEGYCRPNDKC